MPEQKDNNVISQVIEKINGAENILVALSNNPSVDEMSAAIGLTMMLDKIGKRATAIYSGETPNALEFLKPEKTFEADTNSLQDFIIALNKDKADHLRYKVDGDYVKVYITPYRTTITENDLEFSHGDFNVDLIIALDVASPNDLDGALAEHGRIMHDAGAVNITTGETGKFGEIEWSNPSASSVSEMVSELGEALKENGEAFDKEIATALLTGVVAETERFSNERTTPATMGVAAKLMLAGADQQLIAANVEGAGSLPAEGAGAVTPEAPAFKDNSEYNEPKEEVKLEEPAPKLEDVAGQEKAEPEETSEPEETPEPDMNTAAQEVMNEILKENGEEKPEEPKVEEAPAEAPAAEPKAEEAEPQKPILETPSDLTMGFAGTASEEKAEEQTKETKIEEAPAEMPAAGTPAPEAPEESMSTGKVSLQPSAEAQKELEEIIHAEKEVNPLLDELNQQSANPVQPGGLTPDVGLSTVDTSGESTPRVDYAAMMDEALAGGDAMPNPAVAAAPAVASGPEANHIPEMDYSVASTTEPETPPVMQNGVLEPMPSATPAAPAGMTAASEGITPEVSTSSVAEPGTVAAQEGMTGAPVSTGGVELPPPPAPPVSEGMMPPAPEPIVSASTAEPVSPIIPSAPAAVEPVVPSTPEQVGPAPVNDDPAAFRIPGM